MCLHSFLGLIGHQNGSRRFGSLQEFCVKTTIVYVNAYIPPSCLSIVILPRTKVAWQASLTAIVLIIMIKGKGTCMIMD